MKPAPQGRLLLIEDDVIDAERIKTALHDLAPSIEVKVIADHDATLRHLEDMSAGRQPTPDLILLDLSLPTGSGMECLVRFKSDSRLRVVPVIVLTGSISDDDTWRAYHHHANAYLVKPTEPWGLEHLVQRLAAFYFQAAKLTARSDERSSG